MASYFQGCFEVQSKDDAPDGIDIVTDADKASERFIMDQIRKSFPTHDILTEETKLKSPDRGSCGLLIPWMGRLTFLILILILEFQ